MTPEEKDILLKDLGARLPYHTLVHIHDIDVIDYDNYLYPDYLEKMMSNSITLKPYLRPMVYLFYLIVLFTKKPKKLVSRKHLK